jgi:hypothetical protein
VPIVTAVVAALALGACGSSNNDNNSGSRAQDADKAYDGALKFTKCMRDHGVDMPDPTRNADGGITMRGPGGPGGRRLDDTKVQAAQQACAKYQSLGGGKAPDPQKLAAQRDTFVAYARCMRGKGVDMPDPKVSGGGIQMSLGRGLSPDSAVFKAADKACHPLLGKIGGGPGGAGPSSQTQVER